MCSGAAAPADRAILPAVSDYGAGVAKFLGPASLDCCGWGFEYFGVPNTSLRELLSLTGLEHASPVPVPVRNVYL